MCFSLPYTSDLPTKLPNSNLALALGKAQGNLLPPLPGPPQSRFVENQSFMSAQLWSPTTPHSTLPNVFYKVPVVQSGF